MLFKFERCPPVDPKAKLTFCCLLERSSVGRSQQKSSVGSGRTSGIYPVLSLLHYVCIDRVVEPVRIVRCHLP